MPKELIEALGRIEDMLAALVQVAYSDMHEDEKCNCAEVKEILDARR